MRVIPSVTHHPDLIVDAGVEDEPQVGCSHTSKLSFFIHPDRQSCYQEEVHRHPDDVAHIQVGEG